MNVAVLVFGLWLLGMGLYAYVGQGVLSGPSPTVAPFLEIVIRL